MSQFCGSGWSSRSKVTSAAREPDEAANKAAPETATAIAHLDAAPRYCRMPAEMMLISSPPDLTSWSLQRLVQMRGVIQGEEPIAKPTRHGDGRDPDAHDRDGGLVADGALLRRCRGRAVIRHDLRWYQPNDGKHAERNDDEVVEITQDRDEVRNEVNRGKSIARDRHG